MGKYLILTSLVQMEYLVFRGHIFLRYSTSCFAFSHSMDFIVKNIKKNKELFILKVEGGH
jgi:hypothetical protein